MASQKWLHLPKYLPYLSRDTLQSLQVYPYGTTQRLYSYAPRLDRDIHVDFPEIMPLMRSAWPHLRSIDLPYVEFGVSHSLARQRFESHTRIWLSFIEGLSEMQSLCICLAPLPSLLAGLSNLPRLHTLDLSYSYLDNIRPCDWSSPGDESLHLSPSCFPSLVNLKLLINVIDSALSPSMMVLQALRHSQTLTRLEIVLKTIQSFTRLSTAFEAISRILPLKHLSMYISTLKNDTNTSDSNDSDRTDFVVSGRLLSMFFSLQHLQHLTLNTDEDSKYDPQVTIGDQDLHDAAIAWPDLRDISFVFMKSKTHLPRISLAGVQALYNKCPHLCKIEMNGVNFDLEIGESPRGLFPNVPAPQDRQRDLQELRLTFVGREGEDYRKMARLVAAAVCAMFTQLQLFSPHLHGGDWGWGYDVYGLWRWGY